MSSDMQSIQQTGGESPQSQILSANEVFRPQEQQPVFTPPAAATPIMQEQSMPNIPVPPGTDQQVVIEPPKKLSLKTILIVLGIVIIAAGLGYGVYYLITSMKSAPEIPVVPVTFPSEGPQTSPMASPEVITPSPVPLTHSSVIPAPAKTEQIALTALTLADFKTALNASAKEKLLVGSVKDVSFATEQGEAVTSGQFLQSFFPGSAASISFLFEDDFTAWLYGDKTGGNKFGVILPVKTDISAEQLSSSLLALESNPADLSNMFITPVSAPEQQTFKGGPIGNVPVRYLSFSAKTQQVFEYAPVQISGKTYVIIATSYYQMSHMLKLLNAQPLAAAPSIPSPSPAQ